MRSAWAAVLALAVFLSAPDAIVVGQVDWRANEASVYGDAADPSGISGMVSPPFHPPMPAPLPQRPLPDSSPVKVTYGGSIIFQFPNFDFAIGGTPAFAGQGSGAQRSSEEEDAMKEVTPSRVIMKNDSGYLWDGSNYVRSPLYHDDAFANANYLQRIVGAPDQQWPNIRPSAGQPEMRPADPREFTRFQAMPAKSTETIEQMIWNHTPPPFFPAPSMPVGGAFPTKLPEIPPGPGAVWPLSGQAR